MSVAKKRGRKPRPFVTPDGTHVNGLRRRPTDGRWELSDGRTFVEPDWRRAVERYYEMTRPITDPPTREGTPFQDLVRGFSLVGGEIGGVSAEDRMWRWVAEQVRLRKNYVADKTGIEQIGYLRDLRPPVPLPKLEELERVWMEHGKASELQRKKVRRAWQDFIETAKVAGLEDVTPEVVVAYQDQVHGRGLSSKQQQHLFAGIRRVLSFAKKRAIAVDAIGKVLDYVKILTPSGTATVLDPKPIEVGDWKKLLAAAEGDDRAMILLMLNGAFYLGEVLDLRWDDLNDGCLTTRRNKTGKCVRACALWPETLEALARVKRKGEFIFYNYRGEPLGINGAQDRFAKLAEKAGVSVTASQLRDGAYTAAVSANVTSDLCKVLVGHRSGMADHYVLRNPKMVRPATDAIRSLYFGT